MATALAASDPSSSAMNAILRPRSPPFSFACLTQSWYPRCTVWPSGAYVPVLENDPPIRIGGWAVAVSGAARAMRPQIMNAHRFSISASPPTAGPRRR